jgi:aryl-alcohol dehydrogenase-like predicted oxidoreductase
MERRAAGASGVDLSALAFGSMRMEVYSAPDSHWERLFLLLLDAGVTTFHSSSEYESYPRFCRVLKKVRRTRPGPPIQHIVKLAAPHFNEQRFDASLFRERVDSELKNLGAESLSVVQWLLRQTPNSDEARLAVFRDSSDALAAEWESLRVAGKVGALTTFPYTQRFAAEALDLKVCSGLTSYLNPAELEYASWLDRMFERGQGFIAIRPMFAGKLLETPEIEDRAQLLDEIRGGRSRAEFCLRFALLHPGVSSAIVSLSSLAHAQETIAAVNSVRPDPAEFRRIVKMLALAAPGSGRDAPT